MHGLQRILVGLDMHHGDRIASSDLTPPAKAAVDQAVQLATVTGASITLCAALDISEQAFHLIEVDRENVHRTVEDVAQTALEAIAAPLASQGLAVTTVIRFGHGWQQLSQLASEGSYDLVIVGTRDRGATARMLFGSTSQKLMRHCPTPVWIAKPGELRDVREILVANDLSEAAFAATQVAVGVAQALQAKLFVVHALEFPFEAYLRTAGVSEEQVAQNRNRLNAEATENLQRQLARTDARTLTYGAKIEVVEGAPDQVIPRCVEQYAVDLVVIGTVGRTGIAGALLGNTAERLLPILHASLLAVKPPGGSTMPSA